MIGIGDDYYGNQQKMVLRIYSTLFREYAFVKVNRVFYNTVNYNDTIRPFIHYTDWKRTVWSEKNY